MKAQEGSGHPDPPGQLCHWVQVKLRVNVEVVCVYYLVNGRNLLIKKKFTDAKNAAVYIFPKSRYFSYQQQQQMFIE